MFGVTKSDLYSFANRSILQIEALEGAIYILRVKYEDKCLPVIHGPDKGLVKFRSLAGAKSFAATFDWLRIELVHRGVHDEMIGRPSPMSNQMELQLPNIPTM